MRNRLALLLVLALAVGIPSHSRAADDPYALLLEKAEFWSRRDRPDLAREALNTILQTAPDNTDALARLAELEADQGNRARADALLAQLSKLKPSASAEMQRATQAVQLAGNRSGVLAEARRLAKGGAYAEAVAKYKEAFAGSEPPAGLAVEYYQTLAGTKDGVAEAVAGLRKRAGAAGATAEDRLVLARVLTYQENTRREGIALLARMAQNGPPAPDVRAAWRDALLWMNAGPADKTAYETYLAQTPSDTEVRSKLAAALKPAPSEGGARAQGYAALNRGDLATAERQFNAALAENAADAEARAGLGLIRLRQQRFGEAQQILAAATQAAPDKAGRWKAALDSANLWAGMAEAKTLRDNGRLAEAAARVRPLAAQKSAEGQAALLLLADIQDRQGDLTGAEQSYRSLMAADPGNADALNGLVTTLFRQGRDNDAKQVIANLDQSTIARLPGYPRLRAASLRAEAAALTGRGNLQEARSRYFEALSLTPDDPWLRLDYARLLLRQKEEATAAGLMALPSGGQAPSPEFIHASALFEMERGHWSAVPALLDKLPPSAVTPAIQTLRQQASLKAGIAEARRTGGQARERLLALRPQATTPAAQADLATALAEADALPEALTLLRPQLMQPTVTPGTQVQYAMLLLKAEQRSEAAAILRQLEGRSDLSATEQQGVSALRIAMAVTAADAARLEQNYANAYDQVGPLYRERPSDPVLAQAMARIYQSAGRPREALALYEGVLRQDPANADAAQGAATAALAVGKPAQAAAIIKTALVRAPDDPALILRQAQLQRAAGDERAAMASLERAENLRRTALGDGGESGIRAAANPFHNEGLTGDPLKPQDAMLAAIAQERDQVRDALAPQIVGDASLRTRSGSSGTSRLVETKASAGLSLPLFGRDRLTTKATAVYVDAGAFGSNAETNRFFGFGMFRTLTTALQPPQQKDTGVELNLAYRIGSLAADIGTTPFGFVLTRVQGGLRWEPKLADKLQLRIKAERRPVTDSVLSYAGARDPSTNLKWGGVDSTGGSVGVVYDTGWVGFYGDVGYADLDGTNVKGNSRTEASLGTFLRLVRREDSELTIGANLTNASYKHNLRHFSFGHGGYFSPQEFYAVTFPVTYTHTEGDLKYQLGAGIGLRYFREDGTVLFPNDPDRQAAVQVLAAERAATDPTSASGYAGQSTTGINYNIEGAVTYRLQPGLSMEGSISMRRAADWTEGRGLVSLKATLGQ